MKSYQLLLITIDCNKNIHFVTVSTKIPLDSATKYYNSNKTTKYYSFQRFEKLYFGFRILNAEMANITENRCIIQDTLSEK